MTAALIFRRQLVRHSPLYLQQAPRASKLPLEKFHRLLDLAFWGKFLKLHNYHILYFLHSVPGITRPGEQARGAAGGGGQPQLPPPAHDYLRSDN